MSDSQLPPHLRFAAALDTTLDETWHRLSRGVKDRRSAMRHPTLATIDQHGRVSMRTVVLRAASRTSSMLIFHTDRQSVKTSEITAEPAIGIHIWDDSCHLQLRIQAIARVVTGDAAQTAWNNVPEGSRAAYGAVPVPGTAIEAADAFNVQSSSSRFAIIECDIVRIETLCLTPVQHYRAQFECTNEWSGQWLVP